MKTYTVAITVPANFWATEVEVIGYVDIVASSYAHLASQIELPDVVGAAYYVVGEEKPPGYPPERRHEEDYETYLRRYDAWQGSKNEPAHG